MIHKIFSDNLQTPNDASTAQNLDIGPLVRRYPTVSVSTKAQLKKALTASCMGLGTIALLTGGAAAADSFNITASAGGSTPFLASVTGNFIGTVQAAYFTIAPMPNSLTRPLHAGFSAAYLAKEGYLNTNSASLTIPIFGLYAGYNNTVSVSVQFTDGTSIYKTFGVQTPSWSDSSCPNLNSPSFTQYRTATSDLPYDYFLLKSPCSSFSPEIFDTDGQIRWVSTANVNTVAAYYYSSGGTNAIFASDGKSGINRLTLENGGYQKIADFASEGVTFTNTHNIDPGRNGTMLVEVNTGAPLPNQYDAAIVEFNTLGQTANIWSMQGIIQTAIVNAGYSQQTANDFAPTLPNPPSDNPPPNQPDDWFHINSAAYNPADGTLVVSSRESGVFAMDYDQATQSQQRKLHWILGDTTKVWHDYLSAYTLSLGSDANNAQYAPIGQHGVSFDSGSGNLVLMNDGLQSVYEHPQGINRTTSAVNGYSINTKTMQATTAYNYGGTSPLFSNVCGSVYDLSGARLIDFANEYPPNTSNASPGIVDLQGIGVSSATTAGKLVFRMTFQNKSNCSSGWNATPMDLSLLAFY